MTYGDLMRVAVAEVRRIADGLGIAIRIDDQDPATGHPVEVSIGWRQEWDQLIVVRMAPLPGGTGHMAHIRMPIAPPECVGQTQSAQVVEMLQAHVHRKARIAAIIAADLDPLDPPLWSLSGLRATRLVLEARAGGPLTLAKATPQDNGAIALAVAGMRLDDLQLQASDNRVTSPSAGGWDAMLDVARWRYAVSEERPRITIYGMNLPETALNTIAVENMTVARLIDDDVLSGLDVTVRHAENFSRNLILHLSQDREWHAPLPSGDAEEWREGLS